MDKKRDQLQNRAPASSNCQGGEGGELQIQKRGGRQGKVAKKYCANLKNQQTLLLGWCTVFDRGGGDLKEGKSGKGVKQEKRRSMTLVHKYFGHEKRRP